MSRATVGSYIFGLLRRDEIREDGLEGLVGRRDREQPDAVLPGDPRQQGGEAAEVDGLDAQRALARSTSMPAVDGSAISAAARARSSLERTR